MDAERNYILSLLRRPDEDQGAALERFWRVGFMELSEITNPRRREILALVQDNASKDRSTSIRLAAQYAQLDPGDLEQAVMSVDPDGIDVYSELMLEQNRHAQVKAVTKTILDQKLKSTDAVEALQRELAKIRLAKEEDRIVRLPQAGRNFISWLKTQQDNMRSGVKRVGFHWETLNDMVPYLFPGNVILVTAKTKVGKSSFAQDWFDSQLRRGFRGLYFHFEDPPEVMGLKRTARLLGLESELGISFNKMLTGILTDGEMKEIVRLNEAAEEWTSNGTQIWCADWTMTQVVRVWRREHFNGKVDFVVVDYLNKAKLSSHDEKYLGVYEGRARDAEMVKSTTETTRGIAMLVQQEGDDGSPFQTRQAAQKSQVHISLQRERLGEDQRRILSPTGVVAVMNANVGRTGDISAEFLGDYMMWDESRIALGGHNV